MCRVCMDADTDTAFCPCGHLVCCSSCAERLDTCPMCRSQITQMQHIFLPKLKMPATSVSVDTADDDEEQEEEEDEGEAVAMATSTSTSDEHHLSMETAT